MVKILHIFNQMNRGGAEMRTLDLMRTIDRQQFQFQFCAVSGRPGELDDEIRALGGEVHLLPLNLSFVQRFRHLLLSQQFHVVHSHVNFVSGFILLVAATTKIPNLIAHFRGSYEKNMVPLVRRLINYVLWRWINKYATYIVAVSESSMTTYFRSDWERDRRCHVIYNGLDLSRYQELADRRGVRQEFHLPEQCRLYIHVGRIYALKNQERLVSIFATLLRTEPHARLLLVGSGESEYEQVVSQHVHRLGIEDKVVFAGIRTDVPRLLKAADLLLFPSLREGLPGAVLESCAAGTPVLASDLLSVKEIAAHFDLVKYLPLAADDEEWANAATTLARASNGGTIDTQQGATFEGSVFDIRRCLESLQAIWQQAEQKV